MHIGSFIMLSLTHLRLFVTLTLIINWLISKIPSEKSQPKPLQTKSHAKHDQTKHHPKNPWTTHDGKPHRTKCHPHHRPNSCKSPLNNTPITKPLRKPLSNFKLHRHPFKTPTRLICIWNQFRNPLRQTVLRKHHWIRAHPTSHQIKPSEDKNPSDSPWKEPCWETDWINPIGALSNKSPSKPWTNLHIYI